MSIIINVLDHLRAAIRWSDIDRIEATEVVVAALGMAVPVAVGFWAEHSPAGFISALGSLAVVKAVHGENVITRLRRDTYALVPVIIAVISVMLCAYFGDKRGMILLFPVTIAAVLSSYSRSVAVASRRFLLFAAIVSSIPVCSTEKYLYIILFMLAGAVWTSVLSLIFSKFIKITLLIYSAAPSQKDKPQPVSASQKFLRWKGSLTTLAGWDYTLRLVGALTFAVVADFLWPNHHLEWIILTVIILTPRQARVISLLTTQRMLGTIAGVGITEIIFHLTSSTGTGTPALVTLVGIFAGLRAWMRPANYLLYSTVMTPLIILIIDSGSVPEPGLLKDRILATLIGATLVTGASALFKALLND